MIPKMVFHYYRGDSRKQYVDPQVILPRLIGLIEGKVNAAPGDKDLDVPVSERCYRDIFVNDFNISSFHPKKD